MNKLFRRVMWLLPALMMGAAFPAHAVSVQDPSKLDARFLRELQADPAGLYYDVIVVFESRDQASRLDVFGRDVKRYQELPMARLLLSQGEISLVSGWDEVLSITPSRPLKLMNAEGRQLTRAEEVQQALGLTGKGVTVAVIDTGADATHPDLGNVEKNWQVASPLVTDNNRVYVSSTPDGIDVQLDFVNYTNRSVGTVWNNDEYGHGTHVIGTIAGTGAASSGHQRGMAPQATIHSYSTSVGITLPFVIEAYDHIIAAVRNRTADIRIVSNSWGTDGCEFDPEEPVNVATWEAFKLGVLSVFAYGNEGPGENTCNPYTTAPYVIGVGATNKAYGLTGFSSRGIPGANHDRESALKNVTSYLSLRGSQRKSWNTADKALGVFRPGVVAPGEDIVSAQNPAHPMTLSGGYYGAASGTSMATPHVSGLAALILQAGEAYLGSRLSPIDVIRLLEVTANKSVMYGYNTFEVGAGFADVRAAIDLVKAGKIPNKVSSADLVSFDPGPLVTVTDSYSGTAALNSWQLNEGYGVHPVEVKSGAITLRADVSWASSSEKLYISLYAPGVDPSSSDRYTYSAALLEETNYRFVEVKFPQPGIWHIRVDGRVNLVNTPYSGKWEVAYPAK